MRGVAVSHPASAHQPSLHCEEIPAPHFAPILPENPFHGKLGVGLFSGHLCYLAREFWKSRARRLGGGEEGAWGEQPKILHA